jgi:hypothetical protein
MDPTIDPVHGQQQLAFFNAFADEHCFMPFHVYEGQSGRLITTVLRAGKSPKGREIISVLKRIVRRLRAQWPETCLIYRADSGMVGGEVLEWLDRNQVAYICGLQKNPRLTELFEQTIEAGRSTFAQTGMPVRRFASSNYRARSWDRHRRVICRLQVSDQGVDARFIITSFQEAGAKYLYEQGYCTRGKMELMIKDHKGALHSDRTSCTRKEANQFRLFIHSAAYVLMHQLRTHLLRGSELATAQFDTIRLRLLKIGTRVEVGRSYVRMHWPQSYPLKPLLRQAAGILGVLNTS